MLALKMQLCGGHLEFAVGVKKYRRQIADRQRKQCGSEANLRTSRDREEYAFPTSSENLVLVAPLTFPHISPRKIGCL